MSRQGIVHFVLQTENLARERFSTKCVNWIFQCFSFYCLNTGSRKKCIDELKIIGINGEKKPLPRSAPAEKPEQTIEFSRSMYFIPGQYTIRNMVPHAFAAARRVPVQTASARQSLGGAAYQLCRGAYGAV